MQEGNTTQYVYDGFDQLTRENNQAANRTWVYTYDNGGNILTKKEYAYTTGTVGTALSTKTFTYGDSSWKDLLTKIGTTNVTSDTIGNMLTDGEWTYTWKHGQQLSGMSKSGTTVSFSYDADGLRTAKTINNVTTKYVYVGGQLTDVTKGSDTLHIDYDSVGPASVKYNGTYYWYLRNAQGDVTGIVDSSGTRVVTYTYDAWGNPLSTGGSLASTLGAANPLRYRGYVYDTETRLYYLQSRYYDPEICRFINADVFASTGNGLFGGNMFMYCLNCPMSLSDPSGLRPYWEHDCGGIIGYTDGGIKNRIIKYEVPLYYQKKTQLCWAYSMVMRSSFDDGTLLTDDEADAKAKALAQQYHPLHWLFGWNHGLAFPRQGKREYVNDIAQLYVLLIEKGPVYAAYRSKNRFWEGHIVLVTGVDLKKGLIYTNNPWGVRGTQTEEEFWSGFINTSNELEPGYWLVAIYSPSE